MKKKREKVSVVIGEQLTRDIESDDGVVLCRKGTIVTEELIKRLSQWIVEEERRKPVERKKKKAVKKNVRKDIINKLEFEELISKKTRMELEKGATDFFTGIKEKGGKADISAVSDSIMTLVDEIPDNQDVPLKLFELKKHSSYVFHHSVECSIIASFIGSALNYPAEDVNSFALSMMLHDTGVLELPDGLFEKAELLVEEEWNEIRKHPQLGWDILIKAQSIDPLALMIAIGHHTYADGSGYPKNIDFDSLPMMVHLAVIIDVFSALTFAQAYRPAFPMYKAIEIILSQRDKYHPGALENFISVVGIFPITTFLKLNTGEVGVVVRNNPDNLFLPEVKLVLDPAGRNYSKDIVVNLINEPVRKVIGVVENL